jgi:hypothetical protein
METFDLGIAWDREEDNEFVEELNNYALKEGLRPYLLHGYNFYASLKDISEGNIHFRLFLNRTSEDDPVFSGLPDFLKRKGITFINHPDKAKESLDKFKMHLKFNSHDIPVPKTVLLGSQDDKQSLGFKIKYVSKPFVLKPANGSSGDVAILDARSLDDVVKLKEQHTDIQYIAQEKISPVNLENRPAWFRVFYCLGKINPCWWHPLTRIHDILTIKEIYRFGLYDMWRLTKMIHTVSGLDFFSVEMAMRSNEKFIVVDYDNGQPEMRKKSKFKGGLPDEIVDKIIGDILAFVKQKQEKAKK